MPKLVLHHLPASRGSRIFWLLEELGLPYEVKVHPFGPHLKSLKEFNPLLKSPALSVDGKHLTESGAIITQLLAKNPQPELEQTPSEASTYFGFFSEGSFMLFVQPGVFAKIGRAQLQKDTSITPEEQKGVDKMNDWVQNWSATNVQLAMNEVEDFLGKNKWFSGTDKIGLGDFMMLSPLMAIAVRKSPPLGPGVQGWLKRVQARPAFQRAMARMSKEEKEQRSKGKL